MLKEAEKRLERKEAEKQLELELKEAEVKSQTLSFGLCGKGRLFV